MTPSTARATSSALVTEPSNVSTPKPVNHSGIEVAITRMSFAPDSTSCRTRCDPRKPVPPVINVVGGIFLTTAALRFVLFFGTISAVRFFGVLVAIFEQRAKGEESKGKQKRRRFAPCS